ncbi:hypothetical protein DYB26_006795 [Aphanomyces astaci]|uniref:Protein kinase domain-containing protein n=2 Tax=Aphanomyces astaci TaxID=112090 RepID=A0A418DI69_APHAT|nr:hypothetical protein DYB26_006795 [Aphanomyces astaci]
MVFLYVLRRRHLCDRQQRHENNNPLSSMDQIYHTAFTSTKDPAPSIVKPPSSSSVDSIFHATVTADVELGRMRLPVDSLVTTRRLAHSRTHLYVIYLGQCDDTAVVLKQVSATTSADNMDTAALHLMDEMRLLGRLRHPHVVTLIGVSWDDLHAPVAATATGVMEYMNQGDLRSLLDAAPLTWTDAKFGMALHIARACLYLHSHHPVLIHRDLRAQNVLVHRRPLDDLDDSLSSSTLPNSEDLDEVNGETRRTSGGGFLCKLTNFTSARVRSYVDTMTSGVGSAKWVAPEVLRGDDYSERVDMYSFGVVLCELDTHALPFADHATGTSESCCASCSTMCFYLDSTREDQRSLVQDIMTGKALPRFSPTCPLPILQLAKQCLQLDPANRPTARAVVDTLEKLVMEHAWGGRNGDGIYV